MKKFLISVLIFISVAAIAVVGALYYIKPEQKLDLSYEKVALKDLAFDMARRQSTELILSGEDLNNLAKKSLANNPQVEKDILVTGANFSLVGDILLADLNVVWKNKVSAGLHITYRLRWEDPNVVATVEKAKLKGVSLPISAFSDRIIPVGQELPKLLKIKDMVWIGGEVKVHFEKPTLEDLRELLG